MKLAIESAREGIKKGHGGPFGACIVKDDKVIAVAHNQVLKNNDPTCHGEVNAIRKACEKLNTYDLSGCTLYTTGEPCTMCLVASLWANIDKIYYACTIEDNSIIGFRDEKFDNMFSGREKLGNYLEELDREEGLKLFEEYNNMEKTIY
jgi:tRNA(Arg) A34 adenosine deaminase TadA